MELYLTLAIIRIGIFLFAKEYFSIDTTSILIMSLFIVTGILEPEEGFSGFNHPATLTLGCIFVVSAGILKTGLVEGMSAQIIRIAKIHFLLALVCFCLLSALFSAFINDSAVVALMLPMALAVCRETGISPAKLLLPISFSALLGGTCTLIGTSTNILVSSYAEKSGLLPFGMFEFSLPALCLLAIGLLYLFLAGPFILPDRENINEGPFIRVAEKYIAEVKLEAGSPDVNKSISSSRLIKIFQVQVLAITRAHQQIFEINGDTILKQGDRLKIQISPSELLRLQQSQGYKLIGHRPKHYVETENRQIYEVIIPFGSELSGTSLRQLNFRHVYHASVLAIRHRHEIILQHLSDVILKDGDMLLLYAAKKELFNLTSRKMLVSHSKYKTRKIDYKRAIPALLIAIGVVTTAALGITSILISGMMGSLLLVTTSILKPKEAYQAIEWKVIFMMAGVLSMGKALEKTGGSALISEYLSLNLEGLDPRVTLSLIFLVSFLSTNILSSKATAALMSPIVISLAEALGISERPLLVGVMFACSLTFMTPMSYPTNTMVYSPGNYRFRDYLQFGTPLNVLIWIAASFIIPRFFPF
ncbi:SLC13 family permease [Adhaeribacter rhizoryzae]|uniref:SLC13 family permease n=1 Tax=Adhaeribacter rhizoryzae TaxID=2607907 RepID=A0A5M6DJW4_9BACT|nr:SLC13 family permease [Adhaeribacter rhizoryzae]KAA5547834.1 SLC13 family permease [Adhaeribacter rhizoryzae]